MPMTKEERFWGKVAKPGCVIWCGARNSWGYGTFAWESGTNINASRAAWLLQRGEIPDGLDVLHTCNNRQCVNVEHMYLGTDADNMLDKRRAGTVPRGEQSSKAKLTEEQVKQIMREYKRYSPRKSNLGELMKRYGVGRNSIYFIITGRTWKHVPRPE